MKRSLSLGLLIPLIALYGCAKNPAKDVAKADVSSETNAPATPTAAGKTFAFGPGSSSVAFVGSKVTGRHNGGFRKFAGELHVDNGKIADTGNKVIIDTTSLFADNDRLTGHLKSKDFFDVAQYPTATFQTTSIVPNATNSTIAGDLTLHGITKHISFPATIKVTDSSVDVAAQFFLNRFDFEMKYPGKADDLIRKEVVLKLDVKASPGKADFQSLGQPQTASIR